MGSELARCRRRLLLPVRVRRDRRVPPLLHPPRVQGQPGPRNALAIAGSLALQGDVLTWVADHRRHHAFTDKEGDPHSPWLFGTTPAAVARGFWHSHMGWTFNRDRTNVGAYETPIDKMLSLPPQRATLERMPDQGAEPRPDGL